MTWQEKVKAGMNLIAEGCYDNKQWYNCHECPMDAYCDAINIGAEAGFKVDIPETWREFK